MAARVEIPVLTIADVAAWSNWLSRNAEVSKGVWLTLAKKGTSSPTSLTYAQALDEALCHGWIDGQTRKRDEATYAQRFTPRTAKSSWSQRNVGYVARLEREGRMTALGRKAVDAAKADGRWDAAYAGSSTAQPSPEFLAAVALVPEAQAMWDVLTSQNRFAIYQRLNSLKTQAGKERRIAAFVDMLARDEAPYPQKKKPAKPAPAVKDTFRVSKSKAPEPSSARQVGSVRRSARLLKATRSSI
ncbi:hypothetical protein DL764_008750 [Monosporascus ibericus]|uniref:Bacteriocin-protection protein n=1 Tax=Monosporascus ibericus TaxID=155417 RepID=A0A4Q4SWQ4_9PEZI|nr:hypothetical protein DL764_008750 [Monosporascus ibericus]